ncbi:hypothetical protein [Sporolactobacillus sp. KGMB 08714]|uniref:hypothetical protein n=1 Tax=Sporolactobacillus sp. KGMB 08714 TaxID=3064704 RepID=UPI002FBD4E78
MAFETSEGEVIKNITISEPALERIADKWYKDFPHLGLNWDSLILEIIGSAEKIEVKE